MSKGKKPKKATKLAPAYDREGEYKGHRVISGHDQQCGGGVRVVRKVRSE